MSYDPNAPGPPPERPGAVPMPPQGQTEPRYQGQTEQRYQGQTEQRYAGQTEQHYQPQQQPYPPQYAQQGHQQGGGGPNFGVMSPRGRPGIHFYPFWQRSEFWTFLLTALAVGIAAAASDTFDSTLAWVLITILATAYVLSRGLAKREPRSDDDDRPWEPGSGGYGRR